MAKTTDPTEQIPGLAELTAEDVLVGLYEGFRAFQRERPTFHFGDEKKRACRADH